MEIQQFWWNAVSWFRAIQQKWNKKHFALHPSNRTGMSMGDYKMSCVIDQFYKMNGKTIHILWYKSSISFFLSIQHKWKQNPLKLCGIKVIKDIPYFFISYIFSLFLHSTPATSVFFKKKFYSYFCSSGLKIL